MMFQLDSQDKIELIQIGSNPREIHGEFIFRMFRITSIKLIFYKNRKADIIMKKQKLLAVLSALVLALGMTACTSGEMEYGGSDRNPEVIGTASKEAAVTLPAHENWTAGEINQVLFFNGKQAKFPCTLDDLGGDYTFDNDLMYNEEDNETRGSVLYKDKYFGYVNVPDTAPENAGRSSEVNAIVFDSFVVIPDVCINGLCIGDKIEKIEEAMGKPTEKKDDGSCTYRYSDGKDTAVMMFGADDNGTIESMTIAIYPTPAETNN